MTRKIKKDLIKKYRAKVQKGEHKEVKARVPKDAKVVMTSRGPSLMGNLSRRKDGSIRGGAILATLSPESTKNKKQRWKQIGKPKKGKIRLKKGGRAR